MGMIRRQGAPKRSRHRPWEFLVGIAALWVAAMLAYVYVWVVDPYELRSARAGETLADHAYPETIVPRLTPAAVAGNTDLLVVGASTAQGYTPAMLRKAFPDAQHPFNLAFPCATGDDLALILSRLEQSKALKRVII